jgi:tetratricopeptide (TPR) repeat protein
MAQRRNSSRSQKRIRLLAFLRWAAAALVVLAILGSVAYWLFTGWRARDLALKARTNLETANYRMAWLQASSARDLRADEPEVLRTSGIVDAAFGRKESLDAWQKLAQQQTLTTDDQEQRARAAIRFGDTAQFEEAVAALEEADKKEVSSRLRATRQLSRGDLEQAIEEARRGASFSENPQLRLDLAKLLLRRYVDELAAAPADGSPARRAFAEITAIVNSLKDDPEVGSEALAFGLTFLLPGAETQKQWADLAMARMEAGNPALLPAATILVDNKYESVDNLHARLRSVFDAAPVDRRAAYAAWLTRHGLPREAVILITAQEAGENPRAFLARTEALGQMGNWDAVIATAEEGGNMAESVRLLTRARAEYALRGASGSGPKSTGDALRAAALEKNLPGAIQSADGFGAQIAVSDTLVELSGDSSVAAAAFRLARERFASSGDHARLKLAFERAKKAAPEELVVRDYARYTAMIEDAEASPDVEGAARDAESAPSDPLVRVTESLALLRAGQPKEALDAFEDITVFYDRLPDGPQAVICAVLAANGQTEFTRALVSSVDLSKLTPGEKTLIEGIR